MWYPDAERHNIPPGANDPPINPRIIVLHVMEGSIQSADRRFRDGSGIEAHFGFPKLGRPWQWRDTIFQADAQAAGNDYCISFETEGYASEPLNANQLKWIMATGLWAMELYDIPARIVRTTTDTGWGYHRQFPEWNPNNHSCPGDIRLHQLLTTIIPTLQREAHMLTTSDKEWIRAEILRAVQWLGGRTNTVYNRDPVNPYAEDLTEVLTLKDVLPPPPPATR